MADLEMEYRGVKFTVTEEVIESARAEHGIDVVAEIKSAIDFEIDVAGGTPEPISIGEEDSE